MLIKQLKKKKIAHWPWLNNFSSFKKIINVYFINLCNENYPVYLPLIIYIIFEYDYYL